MLVEHKRFNTKCNDITNCSKWDWYEWEYLIFIYIKIKGHYPHHGRWITCYQHCPWWRRRSWSWLIRHRRLTVISIWIKHISLLFNWRGYSLYIIFWRITVGRNLEIQVSSIAALFKWRGEVYFTTHRVKHGKQLHTKNHRSWSASSWVGARVARSLALMLEHAGLRWRNACQDTWANPAFVTIYSSFMPDLFFLIQQYDI